MNIYYIHWEKSEIAWNDPHNFLGTSDIYFIILYYIIFYIYKCSKEKLISTKLQDSLNIYMYKKLCVYIMKN